MPFEQGTSRVLTRSERTFAVGLGAVMLSLSGLSLYVMIALSVPLVRLLEGLNQ